MSKCVVDSNYLRSEKLREFLANSPRNIAVLTDHSAMEAYKGDALITIFKSMEIVSEFPRQVVILKHSTSASRLGGRHSGLQRRLINDRTTRGFREYCHKLKLAGAGDVSLQQELLEQGRISDHHMDRIRVAAGSETFRESLKHFKNIFSAQEMRIVRQKEPFSDAMITKFESEVVRWAAFGFALHQISKLPSAEELTNTFLYRFALCGCFLSLRWASVGGAQKVRSEKLRNDIVDVNFASFATFFDGFLSDDAGAVDIYEAARDYLKSKALEVAVRYRYQDFRTWLEEPNLRTIAAASRR